MKDIHIQKVLVSKVLNFFFPPTCSICKITSDTSINLCSNCKNNMKINSCCCDICGEPLSNNTQDKIICGKCLNLTPYFDHVFSPFIYENNISQIIQQLKYGRKLANSHILAEVFLSELRNATEIMPEALIPVPIHKSKIKKRGYNQSIEIFHHVAKQLHIPFEKTCCQKIKNTDSQSTLSAKERQNNIKNSFKIIKPVNYKHVAIVDDVITTGATANELSRLIKQHGVARVDIWACARSKK